MYPGGVQVVHYPGVHLPYYTTLVHHRHLLSGNVTQVQQEGGNSGQGSPASLGGEVTLGRVVQLP